MTKTAEHTPLPWRISEIHDQGLYLNDGAVAIRSDAGRVLLVDCQAKFKRGEGFRANCPTRDANAAFIVRAVNAHEAMRTALEATAAYLVPRINSISDTEDAEWFEKESRDLLDEVKAALGGTA